MLPFLGPPKWTQVTLGSIRENGNPRTRGDHYWPCGLTLALDLSAMILKFLWQFCFEQYRRTLQFYGLGMYRNLEQLLKMELWPCDSCVDSLSSDFSFCPRIHSSSGFSLWHHPACLPCPASGTQFPLGALHRHLSLLEGLFPPSSLASPVSPG